MRRPKRDGSFFRPAIEQTHANGDSQASHPDSITTTPRMSNLNQERVLDVRHWTEDLFSFKVTRDPRIPLRERPVHHDRHRDRRPAADARLRMASANHEEHLEFFSIKVADGALTSRIQHLDQGRFRSGWPQADRHADPGQSPARQDALSALDRHRPRAVHEHREGSGNLRAVREDRARAWLPQNLRTELRRKSDRGSDAA